MIPAYSKTDYTLHIKQPGSHDELIQSFEYRRSNIFFNFAAQWSIGPRWDSPGFSTNHYVAGSLSTATEKAKWCGTAVLHAIQDWITSYDLWPKNMVSYDAIIIAQLLSDDLGRAVLQFSDETLLGSRPEGRVGYSRAILGVLRKTPLVKDLLLSSRSVHPVLAEEYVQALCQMHDLCEKGPPECS